VRQATARAPGRENFVPDRIAAPRAAALGAGRPAVTFVRRGSALSANAECHLLLALRCAEHHRGGTWEAVGFAALWLSGLVGIVIGLF